MAINHKSKRGKKNSKIGKKPSYALILLLVFLLGSGVGGFYLGKHLIRNDKFEVVGEKVITLNVGDDYTDAGAVAIAFGREVEVKPEGDDKVNTQIPGEYYIKYTAKSLRYKKVARYRVVVVLAPEEGEVIA